MSAKYLYEGNRQFVLTRKLVSEQEIRTFLEITLKQKSVQNVQVYVKVVLSVVWFCIGVLFSGVGLLLIVQMVPMIQNAAPKDTFPFLFMAVCPLILLLIGCYMAFKGVQTFFLPQDQFEAEQREQAYQGLIQRGQCYRGKLREIEILSPTTRRIHYTSDVRTRYRRGMQDASFITTSPVPLDLSDSVVVLTLGGLRVLI